MLESIVESEFDELGRNADIVEIWQQRWEIDGVGRSKEN